MKVVLLSPLPPPVGGIARWTESYMKWCKGKIKVELVNTALTGKKIVAPDDKFNILEEIERTKNIITNTRNILKNNKDVDIFHLNTSCSKKGIYRDWICMRYALKKNIPIAIHCHCNIQDQLGNNKLSSYFFRKMVNKAHEILVLNKTSYEYVENIMPSKSIILPNFVLENQIANQHKISPRMSKVLFVGEIRISKGALLIYELAKKHASIEFRMVGKIAEEMKQYTAPENIIFTGILESKDVRKELDEADIFIFPSLTEGFSNALLEAMARGLPVIASNVGANFDMVENKGGYIISVNDKNGFEEAFNKLQNPNLRKKMSDWNIKKVNEAYKYDEVMNKLKQIYVSMMETQKP